MQNISASECKLLGKTVSESYCLSILPVLIILGILYYFFWIRMLVDAYQYEEKNKAFWILILIIFQIIGGIVYYFFVKKARENQNEK